MKAPYHEASMQPAAVLSPLGVLNNYNVMMMLIIPHHIALSVSIIIAIMFALV